MKKIFLASLFLLTQMISAQEAMTFQDCLALALKNNLDLQSAYNQSDAARYQYKTSYGKLLPAVVGEIDNRNYWEKDFNSSTNRFDKTELKNYRTTLEADFNLFSGFEAVNTVRLRKQDKLISEANVQRVRNAVTIDLAQRFITILYLQEIIAADEQQIQSSQKQLELAELKFNSGVISESEVFKVRSQKATEEMNLLTNQNHLADNLISLKQLMNVPLEKEIVLLKPNLDLAENVALAENQYELASRAVNINPSYTISLLKEKRERAALAIARASRYPVLSMRMMLRSDFNDDPLLKPYDIQLDDNLSKQIRLNLTIPIFNQFEDFAKIKESKMKWKQSKLDSQVSRNQLSKEVLKAVTDTKTSIKKKEASSIAYEFSKKSYEADALKFELGKIDINALNNTKMMYNNSQAELIQARYELLFNNALIRFYLGEEFSL